MVAAYMKIQEIHHVAQRNAIPQITQRAAQYQA